MNCLVRAAALTLSLALVAALGACAGLRNGLGSEASVQHSGGEDDAVKVDELRVRGQVTRLQVTPKGGSAPAYEIVPARGNDHSQTRDASGQRVWTLFSF